jgi:hypothetical protein
VTARCMTVGLIAAAAVAGCADPDAGLKAEVRRAYMDQLDALKRENGAAYCRKVVISIALPVRLAHRLHVPEQGPPGPPIGVEQAIRECTHGYERDPEYPQVPHVSLDVTIDPPMQPIGGVTRTAHAAFTVDGKRVPTRGIFIRYRGDWKMVIPDGA